MMSLDSDVPSSGVVSISPSSRWEGADGAWSTFQIQVGTPGQDIRLVPGTSATAADSIWVIIDPGCTVLNVNLTDCPNRRGNVFDRNSSTTWSIERLSNQGLFTLALEEENLLGLTNSDNAYYGFDTVQLATAGSGNLTMQSQLVAGMATNDFWLGSLGLSPYPFNFTTFNDPVPSLLGSMKTQGHVKSTSWAYTAGAPYRSPPVLGSLSVGGYDASRFNSNTTIQLPFYQDMSRDLLAGIQSITFDTLGNSPLLSQGIYAFLDSLVAQMWLPLQVCNAFETAFNLTWDSTAELYLLTDEAHAQLVAQNPTFTFTIGPQASGGETTQIKLPYASFDLNISAPYVDNTTRYFPLKRAQNSSQYTLGRVFFQEAYVVADYDRQVFNISQALFPAQSIPQQLMAIEPPGATAMSTSSGNQNGPQHLPNGTIAAIGIAAVVVILTILTAFFWCLRKKRRQRRAATTSSNNEEPEVPAIIHRGVRELEDPWSQTYELPSKHRHFAGHELKDEKSNPVVQELPLEDGTYAAHELSDIKSNPVIQELPPRHDDYAAHELPVMSEKYHRHELPTKAGGEPTVHEIPVALDRSARQPIYELPSTPSASGRSPRRKSERWTKKWPR